MAVNSISISVGYPQLSFTQPVVEEQGQHSGDVNPVPSNAADSRGTDRNNDENMPARQYEGLTDSEKQMVEELKQADSAVRAHEMAHVAAGGQFVRSGAQFQYRQGPDGKQYAVAGEVSIDTSSVPGDPEATAEKMATVRRAALAPRDPSAQDRRVAARAALVRSEALMELALLRIREKADLEDFKPSAGYISGSDPYAEGDIPADIGQMVDMMG